jgi:hypothetical protein
VAVQGAGQLAITYLPAMNRVFDTAPIDAGAWLRIGGRLWSPSTSACDDPYQLRCTARRRPDSRAKGVCACPANGGPSPLGASDRCGFSGHDRQDKNGVSS